MVWQQHLLLTLGCIASFAAQATGTREGDRHHGNSETGLFYLFGSEITIVDPVSGDIVNTLEGATSWGDTVYMRDHAQINHYVFANDKEHQNLWVIDTEAQEVVSMIDTGGSPDHMYGIPPREEIWTYTDTNGAFDILSLGDVGYLAHSNLKAHETIPGHGKLLWDPNLQNQAFATNSDEPKIYELDLEERILTEIIGMILDDAPHQCASTHGIAYSYVNQHLYVECSHPEECADGAEEGNDTYSNGTICSGSTWEVDPATLKPVARLVSPALNAKYGDSLGCPGHVFATPDERFVVVTDKYQNYVHFLQPVDGGETKIVEVPVEHGPGKVAFWPKDGADLWGPDTLVTDYWTIIVQDDQVDDAGMVMIDLEDVFNAFEAGESGESIPVSQIVIGAGAPGRPVSRGANFAVTPTGASTSGGYTGVSIVDLETKEVVHSFDIAVDSVQWVPTHDDEKVTNNEIRISALEVAVAEESATLSDNAESSGTSTGTDSNIETMAEAALALSVVGLVGGLMALMIAVRNARHAKAVSNGEFKPFACL